MISEDGDPGFRLELGSLLIRAAQFIRSGDLPMRRNFGRTKENRCWYTAGSIVFGEAYPGADRLGDCCLALVKEAA